MERPAEVTPTPDPGPTDAQPSPSSATPPDVMVLEPVRRRRSQKSHKQRWKGWHLFTQQRLKGWRPILNAPSAELFFFVMGAIGIGLGVAILIASLNVVEYSVRYDDAGPFNGISQTEAQTLLWSNADAGIPSNVSIFVEEEMKPPIYIIFELGKYYQNYRRYVRSADQTAMHDGANSSDGSAACEPFRYAVNDAPDPSLPNNGVIMPCGQIAHSNFNDSFSIAVAEQGAVAPTPVPVDDSQIAWKDDMTALYGPVEAVNYNNNASTRGGATVTGLLNQDQHWIVWMRPSAGSSAIKLYGQINTAISANSTVTISVANRYNTYGWAGEKRVHLSTNSWVGGRNNFLGVAWIAVGGLCLLTALAFVATWHLGLYKTRAYADVKDLSWNKHD